MAGNGTLEAKQRLVVHERETREMQALSKKYGRKLLLYL